jgi:NADH:ubiquinone oxidoreductase subunit 3 (subunit A)
MFLYFNVSFIGLKVLSYFSFLIERGSLTTYSYWGAEYLFLAFFIAFSFILTIILFIVSFYLSTKSISFEKGSSYECGFEPFGGAHSIFNIQYFIVGILFMIFDLEVAYLFA